MRNVMKEYFLGELGAKHLEIQDLIEMKYLSLN